MTIDINRLEMRSIQHFTYFTCSALTTCWRRHRIMIHFWPPAVRMTHRPTHRELPQSQIVLINITLQLAHPLYCPAC